MEYELQEVVQKIKVTTFKLNSRYISSQEKKWIENEVLRLIAKRNLLENKITEGTLLE